MKPRLWSLIACMASAANAQTPPVTSPPANLPPCAAIADNAARLGCYDTWARAQLAPQLASSPPPAAAASPDKAARASAASPAAPTIELSPAGRAALQPSEIARFWDLEKASARDTFELRGYRPISIAVVGADSVNTLPSSPTNGSPAAATAYSVSELKLNLSVRTKLASGLLQQDGQPLSDSVWFAYSQQSYWQLFNGGISRPFRATDHEPEVLYVFGHNRPLPAGWTHRMSGAGVVHHSNGQSQPLSRSWNRVYLMAAADKITANGDRLSLQVKGWQRLPEKLANDDNPDISNYYGRAEIAGTWSFDQGAGKDLRTHTLGLTVRHSLRSEARGSTRLEYLRSLGDANSGLRFHAQLFSGYGDSLIDYNRRRTVLSLGLSLVDW
jgi:phospholipase A1/A2